MSRSPKDTKTKGELRSKLAGRLNMVDVPAPLWDWLEGNKILDQVLDSGDDLGFNDLVRMAKERKAFAIAMAPYLSGGALAAGREQMEAGASDGRRRLTPKMASTPFYDPLLEPLGEGVAEAFIESDVPNEGMDGTNRMFQRAGAYSMYLAKLANNEPAVRSFRRRVWVDGAAPSEEQCEAFFYSPAAAVFSSAWFEEQGIPIVGHEASVLELEFVGSDRPRRHRGKARIVWDEGELVAPFEGVELSSDPVGRGTVKHKPIKVLYGSVMFDFIGITDHLSTKFPWSPARGDAWKVEMFVLAGKTPWVEPLIVSMPEGSSGDYETVDISVWPWVSAQEVASIYERARKELDPTPTTSDRRLSLFKFVMRRPEVIVSEEGDRIAVPSWRELQRSWNARHPEGHGWYYPDARNFRRDFNKAFDQVVRFYRSERPSVDTDYAEEVEEPFDW